MALIIRPVAPPDHGQWLSLWEGYNHFYGRSGPTALDPDITRMTWARFFDAYEPLHALVAERDNRLLGLAHYLFHRTTLAIEPTCYLNDLFTAEPARGQGLGRALLEAVYERARQASVPVRPAHAASTGSPMRPTPPRCAFTTPLPTAPASSSTAKPCRSALRPSNAGR
jgi:GNAT superfamily N-acetyltransferase